MWLDPFSVEGEAGLTQTPEPISFCSSADSYLPLLRDDYKQIVAANRAFGREVTESQYIYYGVQHFWARVLAVMRSRSRLTHEEEGYLKEFEHRSWPIPQTIKGYLGCMGDFTDSTGTNYKLNVPLPNEHGHFGVIDAHNHYKYESLPAPAIALRRIDNEFQDHFPDDRL